MKAARSFRRRLLAPVTAPATAPALTPAALAGLYGLNAFYNRGMYGQGEDIAFLEFTLPKPRDDGSFWARYSMEPALNRPASARILPGGQSLAADLGETDLDLQYAGALAPASRLSVYVLDGGATLPEFMCAVRRGLRAVAADGIRIVSVSLGAGDLAVAEVGPVTDSLTGESWQDAAAFAADLDAWIRTQGMLCCVAAGDSGLYSGLPLDPRPQASWPATQGAVVAVGGTQLALPADAESGEQAWGGQVEDPALPGYSASNTLPQASGGGGPSALVAAPAWQAPLGSAWRVTPDVAAFAGPLLICDRGSEVPVWGTSAAAPILAAIAALYHQASGRLLDAELLYGTARDISSGNNYNSTLLASSLQEFAVAVPGFDACTGAGSPSAGTLPGLAG
jgi:subtilase family serine protease